MQLVSAVWEEGNKQTTGSADDERAATVKVKDNTDVRAAPASGMRKTRYSAIATKLKLPR
jgi:hypothetical protein